MPNTHRKCITSQLILMSTCIASPSRNLIIIKQCSCEHIKVLFSVSIQRNAHLNGARLNTAPPSSLCWAQINTFLKRRDMPFLLDVCDSWRVSHNEKADLRRGDDTLSCYSADVQTSHLGPTRVWSGMFTRSLRVWAVVAISINDTILTCRLDLTQNALTWHRAALCCIFFGNTLFWLGRVVFHNHTN